MTVGAAFAFGIFLAYLGVGSYLIWKAPRKMEELVSVRVSFGCIYIVVSLVYLFTGLQQVFHELGYPLADQACALFSMYTAYATIIPISYFSSYIILGDLRHSRHLMILFVALTCIAIGIISTAPSHPQSYGWGSTWDFDSTLLRVYLVVFGGLPALLVVGEFLLIRHRLESRRARWRITLVAASFICVIAGWIVMPTGREAVVLISRVFLLLGAACALLAYHPTQFLQRRLELEG
jgi:hypothetical protein